MATSNLLDFKTDGSPDIVQKGLLALKNIVSLKHKEIPSRVHPHRDVSGDCYYCFISDSPNANGGQGYG